MFKEMALKGKRKGHCIFQQTDVIERGMIEMGRKNFLDSLLEFSLSRETSLRDPTISSAPSF